jgi:hypothetical protein
MHSNLGYIGLLRVPGLYGAGVHNTYDLYTWKISSNLWPG